MIYLNVTSTARHSGETAAAPGYQAAHGSLALPQAVAYGTQQLTEIENARAVLLCMSRLVHNTSPTADWLAVDIEYRRLATQLQHLAAAELNQVRLFDGATHTVDLGADGNQLVMAGVQLDAPIYQKVRAASLDQPANATRTLRQIAAALHQLAVDESIARANVERLHLCLIVAGMRSSTATLPAVLPRAPDDRTGEETQWHLFNPRVSELPPPPLRAASG